MNLLPFIDKKFFLKICLTIVFGAILYSPSILTITVVLLFIPTLINISFRPLRITVFKDFQQKIQIFFNNKAYFLISLVFWISLFSFFNSLDIKTWWFYTSMKIPFLLLPFAFANFPGFSRKDMHHLFLSFFFIMFFSSIPVVINIIGNQDLNLSILKSGRSIETPIDHIKYSLFVSFSIMLGIIVFFRKKPLFHRLEKFLIAILIIYLFIFLHFLAVRSGIIVMYVNLIIFFLIKVIVSKKYLIGIAFLVFIVSIPFIAYFSIPTFKEKINYSILDYRMHLEGKEVAFSDGERFRSLEVGREIFESNPVAGTGVGDIFKEYKDLYELKYFIQSPTNLPHNQFLTIAVSTGICGLIFFLISLLFPLFYKQAYKDPMLLAFYILIILSFMVENTLERQYSVAFYLVFLLLGMISTHQKTGNNPLLND